MCLYIHRPFDKCSLLVFFQNLLAVKHMEILPVPIVSTFKLATPNMEADPCWCGQFAYLGLLLELQDAV